MAGTFSWLTRKHVPHEDDEVRKYLEEEDKTFAKKQLEKEEKMTKMKESLRQNYKEQVVLMFFECVKNSLCYETNFRKKIKGNGAKIN